MKPSDFTVTDQFCGAGGSSIGAEAVGVRLVLGMNHWTRAIETHSQNFPHADHACCDISSTDPRRFPSTNILISSPECTTFSIARSKKARATLFDPHGADEAERSRACMMDVPRFTEYHGYEIVVVENVCEISRWAGFVPWLQYMHNLGYEHETVCLNSLVAHPTPQSRDRLYVVFWKAGNRKPDLSFRPASYCPLCDANVEGIQTFRRGDRSIGKYRQQYDYRCPECRGIVYPYAYPAASAIDWSLPTQRIGDRSKPLADATRRRVEVGLERFGRPAIVQAAGHTYEAPGSTYVRAWPVDEPIPVQTTTVQHAIALPPACLVLTARQHDARCRAQSTADPFPSQTAQNDTASGNHHALVTPAFYVKNYGRAEAAEAMAHSIQEPLGTVTSVDHRSLVTVPFLTSYYGNGGATVLLDPVPTVTTRDRHALVQPQMEVDDCGFRMLEPHEIKAAMAFPSEYVITGNKREQVRQSGNAVTPPVMQLILGRCVESLS